MSLVAAPAINAKCHAMHSRLLGAGDYDALLRRASVPQIAEYLKNETPYAYVLRRLSENDAHRGQLESVFKRSLFYDYEKLLRFSGGGCKAAIRAMFEAHEINDLKLVVGSICSDHKHLVAADDLNYVRRYSGFGVDALLMADTIEGLAENLKGTRYHEALLPFAKKEKPDYLRIDRALDLLAHRAKFAAISKRLKGSVREACLDAYGQEVDITNIRFIYRMKKLFRYPPADIVASLIPHRHRLARRDLVDMAGCDGVDRLVGMVAGTCYKGLFPPGEESAWETIQAEWFYRLHRKNLRNNVGDANMALSYLRLKEVEIKNIIVILESVRYAIPAQQIRPFLVGSS